MWFFKKNVGPMCVHPFNMDSDFKVMHVKIMNCMGITHISIVAVHGPVYFSLALSEQNMSFESINPSVTQT
jgi:acetaldehyde dehydrogenase (acetylating)